MMTWRKNHLHLLLQLPPPLRLTLIHPAARHAYRLPASLLLHLLPPPPLLMMLQKLLLVHLASPLGPVLHPHLPLLPLGLPGTPASPQLDGTCTYFVGTWRALLQPAC